MVRGSRAARVAAKGSHAGPQAPPAVAFGLVAAAFVVTMLGTTLPTPLYPLYEPRFALAPIMITVIFAIYAFGVIAGLMLFGHLSDAIGRRPILYAGLALSAASAVTFFVAHSVALLFVGRLLSGLSSGVFTGTATATLVDLAGKDRHRRGTILAVAANNGGLGCGTLLSGLLAQYAGSPLRTPYGVDFALLALAALGIAAVPETVEHREPLRWRPQSFCIPREIRGTFVRAAIAGMAAFAVSGLYSAIVPSFLATVLRLPGPALAGVIVFVFFATTACGQVLIGRLPTRYALAIGCGVLIVGIAVLAAGVAARSVPLFFVAAAIEGLGQGLATGFGLARINERVEERRSEVTSTYYTLLYAGLALPVLGVGAVAAATQLPVASLLFCGVVGVTILAVLLSLVRQPESA